MKRLTSFAVLVTALLFFASAAEAGIVRLIETYCISGTPDGTSWDVQIRLPSSQAQIDTCSSTGNVVSTGTQYDLAKELANQINDSCGTAGNAGNIGAYLGPGPGGGDCTDPALGPGPFQALTIDRDGGFFELALSDVNNGGVLTTITPNTAVEFNGFCQAANSITSVPEPGVGMLLSGGAFALVALRRRDTGRARSSG